ncbi:aminopeptidase, partial [Bacillus velezensis]|uniref:aminopeptidase n=1 Tax=Bacillus velezensis TaxID=492670 RepID=UPI0037C13751
MDYQGEGRDLSIEVSKKHVWGGGGRVNERGEELMGKMGREEVFSVGEGEGVKGMVWRRKAVRYGGKII